MFLKKKKVKKQYALFEEAIIEAGNSPTSSELRIDHPSAKCYYGDTEFPILFPLRFLRECRQLDYRKEYDFCFRGLYTPKRDWVTTFSSTASSITFTDHGRKIPKRHFDAAYYQEMARSRFTLCPQGDFKWTYRFLEAILCKSIPVIEPGAEHEQCNGFKFFYSDRVPLDLVTLWDDNIVTSNYNLFLRRHTLIEHFIFF